MHMPAGSVLHNEAAALAALQTAPEPEGGKEEDSGANNTKGVSLSVRSSMLDPKPQMQRGRVQASLRRQNVAHVQRYSWAYACGGVRGPRAFQI